MKKLIDIGWVFLIWGVSILAFAVSPIFLIILFLGTENPLYLLRKYFFWYPNWAIIFASTIAILGIPMGNKKYLKLKNNSPKIP